MLNKILNHYLQFSLYTNPGCYKDSLYKNLPDDVRKIGFLIKNQIIHRVELGMSITRNVTPLKSFHKVKVPWYGQPEDDNFDELMRIWESSKKFRLLKGGLL